MAIAASQSIDARKALPEPTTALAVPAAAPGAVIDFRQERRLRRGEFERGAAPRVAVRIYKLDYRASRGAMAARPWILEFEPTTPTRTDPLMGWIGGSDPRQQLRLVFPSKARAVAFAERQGWTYDVSEAPASSADWADQIRLNAARPVCLAGLGQWHPVL